MAPFLRRSSEPWGQHLYVLTIDDRLVKVGRSWHPTQQLHQIRLGCPILDISLAAVYCGRGGIEAAVHQVCRRRFTRVGASSEWFVASTSEIFGVVAEVVDGLA